MRYVALGDSYTIGTSVDRGLRWPDQLVAAVADLELVANLAVNGYTSQDVIDREMPALAGLRPELLTILVGVNDIVRGVPPERYRRNVDRILDELAVHVGSDRVLAVTTPDYTVTPAGADYGDPATQAAGIRTVNTILADAAITRGIALVDIYDLSLRAAGDRTLVASDGLHPSGAQYELWVERIAPAVRDMLAG